MFLEMFLSSILHVDASLTYFIQTFGTTAVYIPLFCIVFFETGLVFLPFLPGDSLLFAVGAFTAKGLLSFPISFFLLACAAVFGDALNYSIGRYFGHVVTRRRKFLFLQSAHIDRAEAFFKKHGARAIVLARFAPVLRTVVPFIAGAARMPFANFFSWNVVGGVVWVGAFLLLGYSFGNIGPVRDHFELVIVAIVLVSLLPAVFEFVKKSKK